MESSNNNKRRRSQRLLDNESRSITPVRDFVQSNKKLKLVTPSPSKPCLPEGVVDLTPSQSTANNFSSQYLYTYSVEYYNYLREASAKYFPDDATSLSAFSMTSSEMRAILVDWLVDVSENCKVCVQTLHLTVALIDQFLNHESVTSRDLQCLGVTCMFIAAKIEEVTPPLLEYFVHISDNTYTRDEITNMEMKICETLQFYLQIPTVCNFMDRFLHASKAGDGLDKEIAESSSQSRLRCLVSYLLDLSLLESTFTNIDVGKVTAAAVYLARATLGYRDSNGRIWSKTLEYYTCLDPQELSDLVIQLRDLHEEAEKSNYSSVFRKYCHEKRSKIALKTVLRKEDLCYLLMQNSVSQFINPLHEEFI